MILVRESSPVPLDPGSSGSGRSGFATAFGCDPIRLAFLAMSCMFVAMLTFALLQSARIAMFDEMRTELMAGRTKEYSVSTVAKYSGWLYAAHNSRALDVGRVRETIPRLWRLTSARPEWAARTALWACGSFAAATLAVWVALVMLTGRPAVVPYRLSMSERLRTAQSAMWLATPWYIAAAVLVAAAAWYVGFDREGWRTPLVDGLAPTPVQLACVAGIWAVLACALGVVFLNCGVVAIAPDLIDRALCRRCGYSLRGLTIPTCPECGGAVEPTAAPQIHVPFRGHVRLARVSGSFLCIAALLLALACAAGASARSWILLRPQSPFARPNCGWLGAGENARIWRTCYGILTTSAQYHANASNEPLWEVHWKFEPRAEGDLCAASGALRVPVLLGAEEESNLQVRNLPCGPLAFYSARNDPRLHVLAPSVIFADMGDWSRPIPQESKRP